MKKYVSILCLFAIMASCTPKKSELKTFDPAFVHTVYFWLNNPDNSKERATFETSLTTFLEQSKYTITNFIGTPPISKREVVDGSFTYSLVVTFESAEGQELYQKEAAHLKFIEEVEGLLNKVLVYDSKGKFIK